ncbi:MAG TPA: hypothetical protein VG433_00895 [Pirellulales bacterium]|nr:hypothetical protein [Pirellulales bacterium]
MNASQVDGDVFAAKKRGLRRLIELCPVVIIAVVLAVAAQVDAHFFDWGRYVVPFVPFVPGAIQRTNVLHFLLAIVCGFLIFWLQAALRHVNLEDLYVISYLVYPATVMLPVAAMEWWQRGRPGRVRLAAVLAASLAAACIFAIVQTSLACTERTVSVTTGDRAVTTTYTLANLVYYPLESLLLWLAIPMGLTASERRRGIVLGASAAAVVLYVACFTWIIFDFARRSLAGEGPFSRASAAMLLARRGDDADIAALWQAVETADWDEPAYSPNDYRFRCIDLLAKQNSASAAYRLAKLLEVENRRQLATVAAPLMAEYRVFDAVPVLLRFACADGDAACIAALQKLRVPQVGIALLFWGAVEESSKAKSEALRQDRVNSSLAPAHLKVPDRLRKELVSLLGDIKGTTFADWEQHYRQVIDQRPTPLSKEQARQADRVVEAFRQLWPLEARWSEIKQHRIYALAIEKMKAAGKTKQADLIEASAKADATKTEIKLPAKGTPLFDALATLDQYIGQAQAEVKEPTIDLEVPGVDGLDHEVAQFKSWVEKQQGEMKNGK